MLSWQMGKRSGNRLIRRQSGLAAGAFSLFVAASIAILQPDVPRMAAFLPLVVELGYVLLGLFWSNRITAAGFMVMAMTLVDWFGLRDSLMPWVAICLAVLVAAGPVMRRT